MERGVRTGKGNADFLKILRMLMLEEEALQKHVFGNMPSEDEARMPASAPAVDKMGNVELEGIFYLILNLYLNPVYLDLSFCITESFFSTLRSPTYSTLASIVSEANMTI